MEAISYSAFSIHPSEFVYHERLFETTTMKPPVTITLTPGKRVLFLTKDPELIKRQLTGELDLQMKDLGVDDLMDDINTDMMTPAWVCFDYKPEDIARNAYAGLIVSGERVVPTDALR